MNLYITRLKTDKVSLDPTGEAAKRIRKHIKERGGISYDDLMDYVDTFGEHPYWDDQCESDWVEPGEVVNQSTLQVFEKGSSFMEADTLIFENNYQA